MLDKRIIALGACLAAPTLSGCGAPNPTAGAAEAATLKPSAAPKKPVRLVAVGDLMLGSNVKRFILSKGPRYPFRKHRDFLRDADVTFGNLETPLSDRGTPTPGKSAESLANLTNFIFRAPPSTAEGLADAGFDVVSVANNHTMDYGKVALTDTLEHLDKAKVLAVGAGVDWKSAMRPVYLKRNGQRLAFFAISDVLPAYSAAAKGVAGVAPARGAAFEKHMPDLIKEARKQADWVIVSVHWGKEGYTGATPKQKRLGRKLVDWGTDVVIGAHTHVMGPTETYKGSVIHYSLGNFIGNPSSRKNITAWEITLTPGKRPVQTSQVFDWKGVALNETKVASSRR